MLKGFLQRKKLGHHTDRAIAHQQKQERLGFISHNLRSPLTSILALTESHRLGVNKLSLDELLDTIDDFANHSLHATSQLIDLLRVETLPQLDRQLLDATALLEEAMSALNEKARTAQVQVRLDYPDTDSIFWLEGQGELLEKALINLIDNAITYSTPGDQVHLSLSRDNDQIIFHVTDQGCGIAEQDLIAAAQTFGRGKRGMVVCGTGPSFSTHSNLAFYLALCINTLCGRWARAGDVATYPNALLPAYTPKAQPYAPFPVFGEVKLRAFGLRQNASGMPTAALPDEILREGDGQIKALLCLGGNPLQAWPDQARTLAAMKKLDLLVAFDYQMSETARYADYIIAPPLSLEYPGTTQFIESIKYIGVSRGFEGAWAQYSPAAVAPPEGADVMDEREFFFRLAQEMGLQLEWTNFFGAGPHLEAPLEKLPLDMTSLPSTDDLLEIQCRNARIPLAEVKAHPHGLLRSDDVPRVQPRDADCDAFLQLADPLMMAELQQVLNEEHRRSQSNEKFPFTLLCRRDNNFMNSFGQRHRSLSRGRNFNPLGVNSADMEKLGVRDGGMVTVCSRHGEIRAIAEADDSLPPGTVSLSHGFGNAENDGDPREVGSPVTRLIGLDEYDPISGIPRMSALPVAIAAAGT